MARKGIVIVTIGLLSTTHVKWNGKLYWRALIISKCQPLLFMWYYCSCPNLLSIFIVFSNILWKFPRGKRRATTSRVLHPSNFGLCLSKPILYYWYCLIIDQFEYMMSNIGIYSSKIQYSKTCFHIFPPIPISMVTRLILQWSWYHDKFLYVISKWDFMYI